MAYGPDVDDLAGSELEQLRVVAGRLHREALAITADDTTGTITNAHPVEPGECWHAEYGALGLEPFTLTFI